NLGKYLEGLRKIAAHGLVNVCRDAFEYTEPPTFLRGIGSISIRSVDGRRVERISAGDGLQHQPAIVGSEPQGAELVQAPTQGHGPIATDASIGRAQPGNAAIAGGTQDRTPGF